MKKRLFGISVMTMSFLIGLVSVFVFLVANLYDFSLDISILITIVLVILQFVLSPWLTDLSMKWLYKAEFDYEIPKYLKEFIEGVCKSKKMKYPRIGFIDDGAPNAFTYGCTKNSSRIILTRGIFDLLTEDEVKAVVGHELGHAVHYDMAVMTIAQLIPLIFYYLFEKFSSVQDDDDENSKAGLLAMIAYAFYVISQFVILGLSRAREYYADEFSIEVTKSPTTLANALVKIGLGLTSNGNKAGKLSVENGNALGIMSAKNSKSLVICNDSVDKIDKHKIKKAMRWEKWNVWAKWYELFSTHPLVAKRLEAISEKCSKYGEEEYIIYDEKQPEVYVDDFIAEALLILMPAILLFSFILIFIISMVFENQTILILWLFIPFTQMLFLYIKFLSSHSTKGFKERKIIDLLSEIKVSSVTSIPCIVEGNIIGRGDPGFVFNEDFVVKDDTGIMLMDSKRVLRVMDYFDGITKTRKLFDKKVRIKGWYRRSPNPYIQIYEMNIEGEKKKRFHLYAIEKVLFIISLIVLLAIPLGIIYIMLVA